MAKGSGTTKYVGSSPLSSALKGAKLNVTDNPNPYNSLAMASYGNGVINVKPELLDAIERLRKGVGNDEDVSELAVLFHEVNHADADLNKKISQIAGFNDYDPQTKAMEVMNEIRTRVLLPSFAKSLGIKLPSTITFKKTGYDYGIRSVEEISKALGVSKNTLFKDIADSNNHGLSGMANILVKRAGIKMNDAKNIARNMFGNGLAWEDDQKAAVAHKYGWGAKVNASKRKEAMIAEYGASYPNITKPYSREVALQIIKKIRH